MATRTEDRRFALGSPLGALPVSRNEVENSTPEALSTGCAGSESPRGGIAATCSPRPAVSLYANGLGWPTLVRGNNVMLRCGDIVDVVWMTSALGGEVNHHLKLLRLDASVLEVRGSTRRWAFFCQSQPPSITNMPTLSLHGVAHFGSGSLFSLPPSPTCNSESLHWISPPMPGTFGLPSVATVASCALTAIRR